MSAPEGEQIEKSEKTRRQRNKWVLIGYSDIYWICPNYN